MARTTRFTYSTTLEFDPERFDFSEADVTVSFTLNGDEASDIRLELVGDRKAPWGLHHHSDAHFAALVVEMLEGSERHCEAMIIEAGEQAYAALVEAQERRAEAA